MGEKEESGEELSLVRACQQEVKKPMVNLISGSSGFAEPSTGVSGLGGSWSMFCWHRAPRWGAGGCWSSFENGGIPNRDCEKLCSSSPHPWCYLDTQNAAPLFPCWILLFFFKWCQSLISVPQVQIIFTQHRSAISEPKLFSFLAKAWSFVLHIHLQTSGRENQIKSNQISPQILLTKKCLGEMRVSELSCHHWRATGGNTSCSPSRACTSVQIMGLVSVTSIYSWELVIQLKQLERRPAGAGGPTLRHKFCELRGQSRAGLVPGFPRLHTAGEDREKIKTLPENTPRQGKSATASFFPP